MSSAPSTPAPGTDRASDGAPSTRPYTAGLSDGLGDRLMMFDHPTQSSVELLRFKREFSEAPGFEEAVRDRVDELSRFSHPSVAQVRGVQMLDDGLALVSDSTQGRRLSEMVHVARGAPFAIDLIQQLAPALVALHQQGPRIAHGLLTAERIVITREGRLIVVEHVLASAFELLRLPASQLRSAFGIAVPAAADPVGLNQRSDVVQLGFVALSLLLGRRLDPSHYPANVTTLLDEFAQADPASAARLRPWLERALQQTDKPFASAQDAQAAFGGPAATITQPHAAGTPAGGTPQGAPSLRAPADAGASTTARPKADIPKLEHAYGVTEPTEPKIELRVEPKEPEMGAPHEAHTAPPVSSVASPKRKSSKMTAVKWLGAVVALTTIVVGGLFAAGVFSDHASGPTASSSSVTPSTSSSAAPIDVAPLNPPPVAVPPRASEPVAPNPASDPRSPSMPTNAPGQTALDTTPTTPVAGGAGLAGLAPKSPAASADRPASVGGFGGVKVTSAIDLQVFENGSLVGSTAGPIAVVEGSHTFELVNEALGFRFRSTVTVRGGQLTPLTVAVPNGRLSINALPWANVFIDGKPAGQTPLANVPVPIGQHVITFQHPELGEQQQTVIVKADGLTRVSVTFKLP